LKMEPRSSCGPRMEVIIKIGLTAMVSRNCFGNNGGGVVEVVVIMLE